MPDMGCTKFQPTAYIHTCIDCDWLREVLLKNIFLDNPQVWHYHRRYSHTSTAPTYSGSTSSMYATQKNGPSMYAWSHM